MDIFTNNMFFGIFISLIAFEIGYNQGEKIRKLSEKYLKKYDFEIKKDMTGKDRMVFIKLYE